MKAFLNIIGILALLGGSLAIVLAGSAVQEILGGIGILIACTALGLARLIDLQEQAAEKLAEETKLNRSEALALTNFITDVRAKYLKESAS